MTEAEKWVPPGATSLPLQVSDLTREINIAISKASAKGGRSWRDEDDYDLAMTALCEVIAEIGFKTNFGATRGGVKAFSKIIQREIMLNLLSLTDSGVRRLASFAIEN
jgi:hypothetical protein